MARRKAKPPDRSDRKPAARRPTVSVCLIVKNEERFIDQCLKSVRPIADEIVVVDTGSQDRTVEICRKYTDRIYVHPWRESFSEARNHYLEYATGDWIFQIDADEELVGEDIPAIRKAAETEGIDAVLVQIVSRMRDRRGEGVHSVERMFRRNGVIRYEGRVHNRLVGFRNARIFPIRLIHHGYDPAEGSAQKKFERTAGLLKRDLEDDPENPLTWHYLGCSYLSVGRLGESLEASRKAIALSESRRDPNPVFLWTRYNAALCLYRQQDLDGAEAMATSALRLCERHIDSHFILTLVHYERGDWARLIRHGTEYLRLVRRLRSTPEEFGILPTCSLNDEWNLHVLIGIAHHELGEDSRCRDALNRAAETAPDPVAALRAAGIYFFNRKDYERSREYLERVLAEKPGDETAEKLLREIPAAPGPAKREPAITCCMIVKNEEAFLRKCLESVKPYVDEIVIVDTGSTDATVSIAREFTEKVYIHPWEGSFSKARNQALAYVTGDWVFQIDGDEELTAGSGEAIRDAVRGAGDADALLVNIVSIYGGGSKRSSHSFERLFRNNGVIHYEGIVHNRVVGFRTLRQTRVELMHYGYNLEEKKANEKILRTTELLKRQICENPDDPMPHHYLGVAYLSQSRFEEASRESALAIRLAEARGDDHPLYIWSHHNAAMAFLRMGNLDRAEEFSRLALEKHPDHLDSLYTLAFVHAERGEWQQAAERGMQYLRVHRVLEEHPDRAGLIMNATLGDIGSMHLILGHASLALGRPEAMERHYRDACGIVDAAWKVWHDVALHHMERSGDLRLARESLSKALAAAPEEPLVWYQLARLSGLEGQRGEERYYLEKLFTRGTEDLVVHQRLATLCAGEGDDGRARTVLEAALRIAPADHRTLCLRGYLQRKEGRLQESLESYVKAVELQPQEPAAWRNMGEICLVLNRIDQAAEVFRHLLALDPSATETLLRLCETELRRNRVEAFLKHCDALLKVLDLDRRRVIGSMEDVAALLLDIGFALRDNPDSLQLLSGLLPLIPADYGSLQRAHDTAGDTPGDPAKTVFIAHLIERFGVTPTETR
jgi:glycosyltransferase involved in cell wall biosynthesis